MHVSNYSMWHDVKLQVETKQGLSYGLVSRDQWYHSSSETESNSSWSLLTSAPNMATCSTKGGVEEPCKSYNKNTLQIQSFQPLLSTRYHQAVDGTALNMKSRCVPPMPRDHMRWTAVDGTPPCPGRDAGGLSNPCLAEMQDPELANPSSGIAGSPSQAQNSFFICCLSLSIFSD